MARPRKTNADYFSHDTGMRNDLKIKAIRRKYGLTGYAVWCMLLEVITDSDNIEMEYNDDQLELISADFDIDRDELKLIIDYAVQLRLLVVDNQILYSETLKTRLLPLFNKRDRQLSTAKTQINVVIDSENRYSKEKERKGNNSKENDSKVNTNSEDEFVCFDSTELHFSILEYFGFNEMRNPDKLQAIATFLNILNTDQKIEMFVEQFESYRQYKEKSTTAKHSFPKFLGTIENRFLDGGWNQENWSDKFLAVSAKKETSDSPFNTSKTQSLRERIVNEQN